MKIILKLSPPQLDTLVYCFDSTKTVLSTESREVKVSRCILDKVALKLHKKHLETKLTQTRMFEKKPKKISFSLEYYEAHYLEQFLLVSQHLHLSDYDHNVIRYVQSNLNQQLA